MLKIDELNNLEYDDDDIIQKLEKYFDVMDGITTEQLDKRVSLGKKIFDLMMLFAFMVVGNDAIGAQQDIEAYVLLLVGEIQTIVSEFTDLDDYLVAYINETARQIVNTTFEHIDDNYYLSQERMLNIAENEPNSVLEHAEYTQAINSGMKQKQWLSERDNRVRPTHRKVDDNTTIPIDKPFHVGNSLMMYPHDKSLGADDKEIVACRCHAVYFNKSDTI